MITLTQHSERYFVYYMHCFVDYDEVRRVVEHHRISNVGQSSPIVIRNQSYIYEYIDKDRTGKKFIGIAISQY